MSVVNFVTFSVPGPPHGKERARSTRTGRHYTPAKTVEYEALVAAQARSAMNGQKPFNGPVAVEMEVIHTPPPSWTKKRATEAKNGLGWHLITKPDLSNVLKSIEDGGNGVVWIDDRQIAALQVIRRFSDRAEVVVRVAHLADLE